jgi:hypothetical protein
MSYISLPKKGLSDLDKAIENGVKFLNERYQTLLDSKNNINDYDGGVTILLALLQQQHNIDMGLTVDCSDLPTCASLIYRSVRDRYKFSLTDEDIFGTPFLQQLYLTGEPIQNYTSFITGLQTYLDTYQRYDMEGLVSFFNIQNQAYYKYINVGLALVALESNHKSTIEQINSYKILHNKVINGLWGVFNNVWQLEEQYLDPMKAMSLWILFMMGRVNHTRKIDNYINCTIKEQATNGQWINSDVFDGNNLVNDLILTSISVMNLSSYRNLEKSPAKQNNKNNNNNVDNFGFYVERPDYPSMDYGMKAQERGLTAIESSEFFENIEADNKEDESTVNYQTKLLLLSIGLASLYLIREMLRKNKNSA